MGGNAAGAIPSDDHDFAMWEKRVDALVIIAQAKGLFTVDGLRRVLEDLGEDAFETMTYYERWVASLNQNLLKPDQPLAALPSKVLPFAWTYFPAQTQWPLRPPLQDFRCI